MKKKILEINSWLIVAIGTIIVVIISSFLFPYIFSPSTPNTFEDLGKGLAGIFSVPLYCIFIFMIIAGILSWNYLKKSKHYKSFMFFGILDCVIFLAFIIITELLNIHQKFNYFKPDNSLSFIILAATILLFCPLFVNIIGLFTIKNNLTLKDFWNRYKIRILCPIIILILIFSFVIGAFLYRAAIVSKGKIAITENNTHTYSELELELKNRQIIYKSPQNTLLHYTPSVMSQDYNKPNGYYLSELLKDDSTYYNKKFPLFSYNSYTSVVKKINNNPKYYSIGMDDYCIMWSIYYVNGEIYAAINETNGFRTIKNPQAFKLIVSEKNEITIYNPTNNYFVKGGGILDTESGNLHTPLPTTTDISNEQCYKILTVEKVDAQTLDKVSKELYSKYGEKWEIKNKNNSSTKDSCFKKMENGTC